MGRGGINFRALESGFGVLCVVLAAGCRTGSGGDDLRLNLDVSEPESARPSLVVGHRFGRWLEVEPEAAARPALEEACLMEQTGASEEAIEILGKALEDMRACAGLFEARGALYLSTGFPRAAVGDFQRAVALAPENPRGWFALGHAYEILGLSRQALESLEHAHALGGDELGLHLSLARVHRSLQHLGPAARHYAHVLERLEGPPTEIEVEVFLLATGEPERAAHVVAMRERLEACRGLQLSDDAWLLRALVRELPGEPEAEVGATIRALEVAPEELASLTANLLTAMQLLDEETRPAAKAALLASEPDAERRARLERCLAQP